MKLVVEIDMPNANEGHLNLDAEGEGTVSIDSAWLTATQDDDTYYTFKYISHSEE